MPPILTTDGYIGVGKQAAWNTPVAPTAGLFIKYISESLGNEQEEIKGVEGGQGRYLIENYKTTHKIAGAITCYARPDILGFLLHKVLGADGFTAATGATPSIHVLTAAAPAFFTIERGVNAAVPTLIERLWDCHINDITIEGESSQPVKVTANIIGTLGHVEAAATAVTFEANNPIMFFDAPSYKIDGAAASLEISKWSIKISNNFDTWFGTTLSPAEIIEKMLTVDVSFTVKFLDATHYKKVYYGAGVANVPTYATGSLQVKAGYGAAATLREFDINVKHIKHTAAPINLAGTAAPIFQECTGYAVKVGADNLIDPVIKNSYDVDMDT